MEWALGKGRIDGLIKGIVEAGCLFLRSAQGKAYTFWEMEENEIPIKQRW